MTTVDAFPNQAPAAHLVQLPADCRIGTVEALAQLLVVALEARAVALDGREVARVDTAALQLLVVFQLESRKRGHSCAWLGISDALRSGAAALGLSESLSIL